MLGYRAGASIKVPTVLVFKSIVPLGLSKIPEINFIKVVFPAPLLPIRPAIFPFFKVREILSKTGCFPKL